MSEKPSGSKIVKYGGGCLVMAVVFAGISTLLLGTGRPKPQPTPPVLAPPLEVSAAALFTAYHANEVAADNTYKNKRLSVTGTMQSIDKDAFDNVVIRMRTDNQFMPVDAYLDKSQYSIAATLVKEKPGTFICTGAGMTIGRPSVKGCVFVP